MGLLTRLERALGRLTNGHLRAWSPSSLDPYGIVPAIDARREESERRARDAVVPFEPRGEEIDRPQRSSA